MLLKPLIFYKSEKILSCEFNFHLKLKDFIAFGLSAFPFQEKSVEKIFIDGFY